MWNSILVKHVGCDLKPVLGIETGYGALGFKNDGMGVELVSAGVNGGRHNLGTVAFPAKSGKYSADMGSAGFIKEYSCVCKNGVPVSVFKKDMGAAAVNCVDVLIMVPLFHHKNGAAGHENLEQLIGCKVLEMLLDDFHTANIGNKL